MPQTNNYPTILNLHQELSSHKCECWLCTTRFEKSRSQDLGKISPPVSIQECSKMSKIDHKIGLFGNNNFLNQTWCIFFEISQEYLLLHKFGFCISWKSRRWAPKTQVSRNICKKKWTHFKNAFRGSQSVQTLFRYILWVSVSVLKNVE